jgi:hypothetical protein
MNGNAGSARDRDMILENVAVELTDAAFPVALRSGVVGSSIDLQLDFWRVFVETIKERRRNAGLPSSEAVDGRPEVGAVPATAKE